MIYTLDEIATLTELPPVTDERPANKDEIMTMEQAFGLNDPNATTIPKDPLDKYPGPVRSFIAGLNTVNAGLVRAPGFTLATAYYAGAAPQNVTANLTGWNIGAKIPGWMVDNPLGRYYDRASESWSYVRNKYPNENLFSIWKKGDASEIADYYVNSAIEQTPYVLTAVIGSIIGIPSAYLAAGFGVTEAARTLPEAREKGLNDFNAMTVSLANGTSEAFWERFGTLGFMDWAKGLYRDLGPEVGKAVVSRVIKNIFVGGNGKIRIGRTIAAGGLTEFSEEFGTQLTQDFNSKVTGLEDIPWRDFMPRAIEAGLTAFGTGVTVTGSGGAVAGIQARRDARKIQRIRKRLGLDQKSYLDPNDPIRPVTYGRSEYPVKIGVAPFRNVTFDQYDEILESFRDKEYVSFRDQVDELARRYGISIDDESETIGGWRDTDLDEIVFEPSLRIEMATTPETAEAIAASIGQRRNQQSVYVAIEGVGNGFEYVLDFANEQIAFEVSKMMPEYGIEGYTINKNRVYIGDQNGTLEQNIERYINENAETIRPQITGIEKRRADIRFIEQKDYNAKIQSVPRVSKRSEQTRQGFSGSVADPAQIITEKELEESGRVSTDPSQPAIRDQFQSLYTPAKLDADDARIQELAANKIERLGPELLDIYREEYGNVANVDDARELFRDIGYNGLNANTIHEPVSAFMKIYREILLEEAIAKGNKRILILAGGSGAGKSTLTNSGIVDKARYGAIFDSTLADSGNSMSMIRNLTNRGFTVDIVYVHRDAVDAWINGVLPRVQGERQRAVPANKHIQQHIDAPRTIGVIAESFGDQIAVEYYFNETDQDLRQTTIDEIKAISYDEQQIKKEVSNATEELRRAGKISEEAYAALSGIKRRGDKPGESGVRAGTVIEEEGRRGRQPDVRQQKSQSDILRETQEAVTSNVKIQGRINKLASDQEAILLELGRAEQVRDERVRAGKPTKAIDKAILRLNQDFDTNQVEAAALAKAIPEAIKLRGKAIEIPANEINKLQALATKTAREEGRAKAREQAQGRLRKSLLSKIKTELKRTAVKKQSGKPVGKFTPDIQEILDEIRSASKLTQEEALEKIQSNISNLSTPFDVTDEIKLQNQILEKYSGLESKTIVELDDILSQLRDIKTAGRTAQDIFDTKRKERIADSVEKVLNEITAGQGVDPAAATVGIQDADKANTVTAAVKNFGQDLVLAWDDFLNVISGKSGVAPGESFIEQSADVFDVTRAQERGEGRQSKRMADMIRKAYGLKNDDQVMEKISKDTEPINLGTYNNMVGNKVTMVMTKNQARKKWMEMQDPTLQETFDNENGMSYSQEIRDAIDKFLTPQDKAFARAQLDFYQEYYNGVNEIYRIMYGVNLPFNPFYSPIRRTDVGRDAPSGFTEFMVEMKARRTVTSGSLKSRVRNVKPLEMSDDLIVLNRHVAEMEHFKAWAEKIRDLYAIYGNTQVKQAIVENYGIGTYQTMFTFLEDFARNGIDRSKRFDAIDWWRIRTTQVALAIRPSIAVKQLTSFIAFADNMPIRDFIEGQIDFWKNPIKNTKTLMESGFIEFRGQNIDRDIKAAMKTDAFKAYRRNTQSFINRLMLNVQLGDKAAIIVGGWSVYRKARKDGMSHKQALREFEKAANRTQQSGDLARQSRLQRGGSFAKLFTMFGTTPNEYLRREISALRNFKNKRIPFSKMAKTLAIYHVLLPMLFQWVSDFGEIEEKKLLRAAILGNLNGLFMLGDFIENVIKLAIGERIYSNELPINAIGRDLQKLTGAIKSSVLEGINEEDMWEAMEAMLGIGGFAVGFPARQTSDMIKSIGDIYNGEYRKGVGGLLGWPKSAFEQKSGGAF